MKYATYLVVGLLGSLPVLAEDYPTDVYFGDTHHHTGNSFDVYLFGTPSSTLETAYRFAKGERVINPTTGTTWQLSKPLDFLVIADHAESLGAMPRIFDKGDKLLTESKTGKAMLRVGGNRTEEEMLRIYASINQAASGQDNELGVTLTDILRDIHSGDKRKAAWERNVDAAEKHNKPGEFSAIIGWEWTSITNGANLHRVIFQKEGGDVAKKYLPFSTLESDDPEGLWKWLDETSEAVGATFVAIPHNSNVSRARMFPLVRNNGEPVDEAYAKKRVQWEPVVEVTQIKGDSEVHPVLAPNDEFADFENYDFVMDPEGSIAKPDKADYVRSALKRGLEFEAKLGTNPYKFGMIGSTDTHTGIAAVEEDNFGGKGQHDSKPTLRSKPTGLGSSKGWDMAAAGYAAVWAKDNTRASIVEAFQRKEVYATTGPRIKLRFFGGYEFTEEDATGDIAKAGYSKGIPMGGDLKAAGGKPPSFLVAVMKDPDAAHLDRVQIVKGWLDAEGESQEQVYDIAVSGERTIGADGRCKEAVGNTVDLTTGKYTNDIGSIELTASWTDPDFDPSQRAFYYVRAMEIPTPRYSLLDAIALGIDVKDTNQPATIQERVYSSPIWYTP